MKYKTKQKGSITVIVAVILFLVLCGYFINAYVQKNKNSSQANVTLAIQGTNPAYLVTVDTPATEVSTNLGLILQIKNTTGTTKTLSNLVAKYSIVNSSGSVVHTSNPISLGTAVLRAGATKTVSVKFNVQNLKLADGVYTLKAEFVGYGAGEDTFTVKTTPTPSQERVVGINGNPTSSPTPVPPRTPSPTPSPDPVVTTTAQMYVTLDKATYAVREAIKGSVIIVNTANTPLTLKFNSGCLVSTALNGVTMDQQCTMALTSIIVPANGSRTIGFYQAGAAKAGLHTLTVELLGSNKGQVTMSVGVGSSKSPKTTSDKVTLQVGGSGTITPPPTAVVPPSITPPSTGVLPPSVKPNPIVTPSPSPAPVVTTTTAEMYVTLDKATYAVKELIKGKVFVVNPTNAPLTLNFTSGCQVTTALNGVKMDQQCTMALTSITIPAKGSQSIGFYQTGGTRAGLYTLTVGLLGNNKGQVTMSVGVGSSKSPKTTSDKVALLVTSSTVTPPTTVTPPVVVEPDVPVDLSILREIDLTPKRPFEPIAQYTYDGVILSATTKAQYVQLEKDLQEMLLQMKTPKDKAWVEAYITAVQNINTKYGKLSDAEFSKKVNTVRISFDKGGVASNQSKPTTFFASVMYAIKNLFAQIPNKFGLKPFSTPGFTTANNDCTGRYELNELVINPATKQLELADKVISASDFAEKALTLDQISDGICGVKSAVNSLETFKADPNMQYKAGGYMNRNAFESALKNADLLNRQGPGNSVKGLIENEIALLHEKNSKDPSLQFDCYLERDVKTVQKLKEIANIQNTCKADITVLHTYATTTDELKHSRHAENLKYMETQGNLTIMHTLDSFQQGDSGYVNIPISSTQRPNSYSYSGDNQGKIITNYMDSNVTQSLARSINNNQIIYTDFLICIDKSKTIRTTPANDPDYLVAKELLHNLRYAQRLTPTNIGGGSSGWDGGSGSGDYGSGGSWDWGSGSGQSDCTELANKADQATQDLLASITLFQKEYNAAYRKYGEKMFVAQDSKTPSIYSQLYKRHSKVKEKAYLLIDQYKKCLESSGVNTGIRDSGYSNISYEVPCQTL